jgi:phospholipid transport system substrate-binding protein
MTKTRSPKFSANALAAFALLLLLIAPSAFAAETAVQVIDRFHNSLVSMMKRGPELGFQGRVKFISPVADQTFDYTDMTERSVGPAWATLSAADRAKLIASFRKFSIYTYVHNFRSFDGERFEHVGEPKVGAKGGVLARTQLVPNGDEPVALNYLLHRAPGWKVYDIFLAGTISEVARRRDDFSAILRDKGAPGMIAALEEKSATLQAEDAKAPVAN